jgi:tRNA(Ile)-lysidine synthase
MQALAVRAFLVQALGDGRRLERVHVEQVLELARAGKPGEVALPGGKVAVISGGRLTVGPPQHPGPVPLQPRELPVPGLVELPELGWRLSAELVPRPPSLVPPSPLVAYLDPGKLRPPLTVRTRRPGDRLRPVGMAGEKKVKALLMEAKVPPGERDRWPLVCDQGGIVWVVGVRIADGYKVEAGTSEVLRLEAKRL